MDKFHQLTAEKCDLNRILSSFKVGDLVYVKNESRVVGETQKLVKKFRGPFKVVAIVDPVTVKLELLDKTKRTSKFDTFHVSKLKPYEDGGQTRATGGRRARIRATLAYHNRKTFSASLSWDNLNFLCAFQQAINFEDIAKPRDKPGWPG